MGRSDLLPKVIGLGTWGLVTLPLWGALVAPFTLAWLVLLFNAYWLLRSSMLGRRRDRELRSSAPVRAH